MADDAGGQERPAGGEIGVDLEGRVDAPAPRRGDEVGEGEEAGQLAGGTAAHEDAAIAGARGLGPGALSLDLARLAAHEHELHFRNPGRRVHQQVHALVLLEVAGVEDDRTRIEPQGGAQARHFVRGGRGRVDERRVLDLEDGRAGRARPDAFGEARAHGDHGCGLAQGVPLERGRRPGQGPAAREGRLAELVGDGRVDVHDQGQAKDTGERRGQVRGLLHGMHDVEAAGQHPPRGLGHEGHVEKELGQRRPGADVPDGQTQAPAVVEARNVHLGALGEREQLDVVPGRDERAHHGQHGQRSAADLEERLGGEEQDAQAGRLSRGERRRRAHAGRAFSVSPGSQSSVTCSPRNRSASMAAMHPLPAAVTACR